MTKLTFGGEPDPFLGATGYFDGTDASLLAQEEFDPKKLAKGDLDGIRHIHGSHQLRAPDEPYIDEEDVE